MTKFHGNVYHYLFVRSHLLINGVNISNTKVEKKTEHKFLNVILKQYEANIQHEIKFTFKCQLPNYIHWINFYYIVLDA